MLINSVINLIVRNIFVLNFFNRFVNVRFSFNIALHTPFVGGAALRLGRLGCGASWSLELELVP